MRSFLETAQRIRVPAGFALGLILVLTASPTWQTLIAGGFVASLGLVLRAWASGYLKKNQELATSGPYAYTRNPLYLGNFLLGIGVAISAGAAWLLFLFGALYLIIYVPVMLAEAQAMFSLFPDQYQTYRAHVPLFLPRLYPYRIHRETGVNYDGSLYMKHREYRAALGLLSVLTILAARVYFSG